MRREALIDFIARQDLSGPIRHGWTDDDPLAQFPQNNPETETRLSQISDWGKFAYALGCADWVLARLKDFTGSTWPWQFRDACWAFALDPGYRLPEEIEDHPQEGPVDGPTCLVLTTVLNTRYGWDENNGEIDAAMAELIAQHVLPDLSPFLLWRDKVLGRLLATHPRDASGHPGQRVTIRELEIVSASDAPDARHGTRSDMERLSLADNPYALRSGVTDGEP